MKKSEVCAVLVCCAVTLFTFIPISFSLGNNEPTTETRLAQFFKRACHFVLTIRCRGPTEHIVSLINAILTDTISN